MQLTKIKIGDEFHRNELQNILEEHGYQVREWVSAPGEFARRGSTFDIYPVSYRSPVRIDFAVKTISSIRDFSIQDGRSMTRFDEVFIVPVTESMGEKIDAMRKTYEAFDPVQSLKQLVPGDFVVHDKYGIGKFLGTKRMQSQGKKERMLAVEYAKQEILYFNVKEPLERYIGGEGKAPKLTKLQTKEWERLKDRTRKAIHSVAGDLLEIQAKRVTGKGIAFKKDQDWQREFESEFPFQETEDQLKAIADIKKDMESKKPMDRLVAGDVGYGKTEVAMRAAFKAVASGYQVAILVPTTILAEQHYLVLKERVKSFPVTVEALSRFRTKKEQTAIVETVKRGTTDIVVGTHRLLSKDVQFNNLGLLIIDEEQRFGVQHKEKLKALRSTVDVLTMTATPIPRTLYMSLVGVRDMSAINTPPKQRLPVETTVMEYDDRVVKQALEEEFARGGQAYFVHNRVKSIEKVEDHLKELLPNVTFCAAHGQMPPHSVEAIMKDFLEKKIDCLVSTSIIESGIDLPNVNTIIVNRADLFGLSDLYQLRGRVGRYREKRQAYAYFMVPKNWALSGDAQKRLSAIERFTDLGSGFKIALEDMEIRGAGNLLGHQQSGFIHAVGFDLYCKMLKQAIDEMKK